MQALWNHRFADDFSGVRLEERPAPEPGPGEVRVRMHMAPVNPSDLNHVRGTYAESLAGAIWNHGHAQPAFDPERSLLCPLPPLPLGGEGLGTVESAGSGWMAQRLVGRRVAVAAAPTGTWAEYIVVPARRVVPLPDRISDEQGAMFFVNPLTAWILVHRVLKLRRDETVLVSAAGSALGRMVLRMSRDLGYRPVAVVRRPNAGPRLMAEGAAAVIATEESDVREAVLELTEGRGVDAVLDCVGGDLAVQMLGCLARWGRMVVYGTLSPDPLVLSSRTLMMPVSRLEGFFLPNWLAREKPLRLLQIIRAVRRGIAEGLLTSEVEAVMDWPQWPQALEAAAAGGRSGKILMRIAP